MNLTMIRCYRLNLIVFQTFGNGSVPLFLMPTFTNIAQLNGALLLLNECTINSFNELCGTYYSSLRGEGNGKNFEPASGGPQTYMLLARG